MRQISWPDNFYIEQLNKNHEKKSFQSGIASVDEWLKKNSLQSQKKRLSITRVLIEGKKNIAGYYTLAIGQVNFDLLPLEITKKLPAALLPVITLAWLGLDQKFKNKGLGKRLLAQALADCYNTGQIIPFVAVLLDCATIEAKSFYQHFDFEELPGHKMKLMLPWKLLNQMMNE
jgi:ribosomal protein S18 acetylase RimI-like enzyme